VSGIEIKGISKTFGSTLALDNVDVILEENKIYGLLGRNGAGKSTLLNIITNRIFPENGEVFVDGVSVKENNTALSKIYLMSEKNNYPESMKVKEVFRWSKEFYPDFDMEYARNLAEQFELNTNKLLKNLSTGYTSIFKVITALSTNVPYILLDEPVLGLDANHRDLFYRILLSKYSENPCCIVISTHLIEEVSNVIEDIIMLKKGRIIQNRSRDELLSMGYTVSGKAACIDSYIADKQVIGIDVLGGLKTAHILGTIDKNSIPDEIEVARLDLQKLFIQLTNA
jgi:ABC-2 type transport system ATP-binding protein